MEREREKRGESNVLRGSSVVRRELIRMIHSQQQEGEKEVRVCDPHVPVPGYVSQRINGRMRSLFYGR